MTIQSCRFALAATVCVLLAVPARLGRAAITVDSPNDKVKCIFNVEGGQLSIAATINGAAALETSPIHISVDGHALTDACMPANVKSFDIDETYPWRGSHSTAINRASATTFTIASLTGQPALTIEARAYDNGVAYRYVIPAGDGVDARIPDETTVFVVPSGSTVWHHDLEGHYESVHTSGPVEEIKPGEWIGPPMTYKLPGGSGYAAITEANLVNFSGMALQAAADRRFTLTLAQKQPASYPFRLRYKNDVERMQQPAKVTGTITSPWRVILLGKDLNALVNADVIHNLCPPPDPAIFPEGPNTAWCKPGRAVWKYLDGGENTLDEVKHFSRLAGQLGFEYQVVEGFWRRWSEDEIRDAVAYSHEQGVGLWFWRGSSQLRTPEARSEFFTNLERWGVVGAKIDFFDHEHKEIIDLYVALLEEAARHKIMVNFHGANKPTGLERTWPNLITLEGVKGMEARRLDDRARHDATLPFTRYLAGPGDYTPTVFNERRGNTTYAHQIAVAAVFDEPLLTYGGHPQSLLDSPALAVIKSIPSVWDETIVLPMSAIGELAVMARRHGDAEWFLAALNGGAERTIDLPLDFLGDGTYEATYVRDGAEPTELKVEQAPAHRGDALTIRLAAGGGFLARFYKPAPAVAP